MHFRWQGTGRYCYDSLGQKGRVSIQKDLQWGGLALRYPVGHGGVGKGVPLQGIKISQREFVVPSSD